ncbi:hypothetical protein LTR24_009654 [Lithohypha guttulata]|uniref:N-acetyltransferase domain-containing protein n=1 Tax=Lithohypha guttulata TaxID=1690604 RepID=A0ABR0JWR2_9EURO|nr:hypothetical protein LTR24_009654 [Lithohypha guttulata]
MEELMREVGFVDVTVKLFKVPIGTWPANPTLKQAGSVQLVAMLEGLEGLNLAVFTRCLGWSIEDTNRLVEQARQEFKRKKTCYYWPGIETISPADLLDPSRRDLLCDLNKILNDAYFVHGNPRENGEAGLISSHLRIRSQDQLVHELGPEGYLAICFDDSLPDTQAQRQSLDGPVLGGRYMPGKYGRIVATASLKPFKGKTVDVFRRAQQEPAVDHSTHNGVSDAPLNDPDLSTMTNKTPNTPIDERTKTWNWEIAACASANGPRYRGQGLMVRCLDELVHKLVARRDAFKEAQDPRGNLQVKLWSSALDGSGNTEYWIRRGFIKEGEPDVAPKGVWTSTTEFKIQTLSKVVG